MSKPAHEQYADLMIVVRKRFDLIRAIRLSRGDRFSQAENAAFHGRKIIEAVAFGCLVAIENGLKAVPRDARGQWSAETILSGLDAKKLNAFPSSVILREATGEEQKSHPAIKVVIEAQPDKQLGRSNLIEMYVRFHRWLHEINPYVEAGREVFLGKYEVSLWEDLGRLELFLERHDIGIGGKLFFCVLRDKGDGMTKVLPLSKQA